MNTLYLWDIFRSSSDEEVLLNGHLVAGIRAQQPCTGCSKKNIFLGRFLILCHWSSRSCLATHVTLSGGTIYPSLKPTQGSFARKELFVFLLLPVKKLIDL